jgi:hypothetical protein
MTAGAIPINITAVADSHSMGREITARVANVNFVTPQLSLWNTSFDRFTSFRFTEAA